MPEESSASQSPGQPAQGSDALMAVLLHSQEVGFLGPGPVQDHVAHAHAFGQALTVDCSRILDLGSGGGIPGLVLLWERPSLEGVLLDARQRRCEFLRDAVEELGMGDRVQVWQGRAEELAHDAGMRHSVHTVVSRSFGPPAQAVECAMGYAEVGGSIIVSEPPGGRQWPVERLAELGLAYRQMPRVAVLDVVARPSGSAAKGPRKIKVQKREPLFVMPPFVGAGTPPL